MPPTWRGGWTRSPAPPPSIHQGPIKAESVAILLLSLGPIAGLFEIGLRQGGWLLAFLTAATLVVRSAMWSRREKLVGLLVVPAATLASCTALAWRVTASGISSFDVFLLGVSGALGGIYLRQRVDARIAAVFSRRSDR